MKVRAWAAVGAAALLSLVVAGATAWACVSGASVSLSTAQAKAGQEVGIRGAGFGKTDPVVLRFGSLDGPVVATLTPSASAPFGNAISGPFTVPTNTKPGDYVVIATQSSPDGKISNAPVRVLLTVIGEGGSAPVLGAQRAVDTAARQPGLATTDNSVSVGALALVALGVAGIGMFVAGIAVVASGRRVGGEPTPARQRA